jgi:hypothetical protein
MGASLALGTASMTDHPHHFVFGRCFLCDTPITFDPTRVPSVPLGRDGLPVQAPGAVVEHRAPLCRECVLKINADRRSRGMPTWDEDERIWETVEGLPE